MFFIGSIHFGWLDKKDPLSLAIGEKSLHPRKVRISDRNKLFHFFSINVIFIEYKKIINVGNKMEYF